MDKLKLSKIQLEMTSWKSIVRLPLTMDHVKAIKIRWMYYTTASTGNKVLHLACSNFNPSAYILNDDGSTDTYFFSMPLDPSNSVTCLYSDFNQTSFDLIFDKPIQSINQFTLEASINGISATDISPTNALVFEMGFYS